MLASKDFKYCPVCQQEICLYNCKTRMVSHFDKDKNFIKFDYIIYYCPYDRSVLTARLFDNIEDADLG